MIDDRAIDDASVGSDDRARDPPPTASARRRRAAPRAERSAGRRGSCGTPTARTGAASLTESQLDACSLVASHDDDGRSPRFKPRHERATFDGAGPLRPVQGQEASASGFLDRARCRELPEDACLLEREVLGGVGRRRRRDDEHERRRGPYDGRALRLGQAHEVLDGGAHGSPRSCWARRAESSTGAEAPRAPVSGGGGAGGGSRLDVPRAARRRQGARRLRRSGDARMNAGRRTRVLTCSRTRCSAAIRARKAFGGNLSASRSRWRSQWSSWRRRSRAAPARSAWSRRLSRAARRGWT